MNIMEKFRQKIYKEHDIICNQKYGDTLPYSFHLNCVEIQGFKFFKLIPNKTISSKDNVNSIDQSLHTIITLALISHDAIEDARMTYGNLLETVNTEKFGNYKAAKMVADIVYCVTDEKGKSRKERKSQKYYDELKENKYAVFVKLADLAANTLFSKLTGSTMYDKYKKEFPNFKEQLFLEEYKEFFDYIENI